MARKTPKAKWIWLADDAAVPDYYLRARREFSLRGKPAEARLLIAAFSEYVLYVNGRYVGTGGTPSGVSDAAADEYTGPELRLKRGKNVLAVLCHNPYVTTLRRPRVPGGLWAHLEVTYKNGSTMRVATDRRWRVAPAEDLGGRSPRLYSTAGFCEIRDTRREPEGWDRVGFKDRSWAQADEATPQTAAGRAPATPRPSPVPRPAETFVRPHRVQSVGTVAMRTGVTAIPFVYTVREPAIGEFYAGSFLHSATKRRVRLTFDCDEGGAVYVNNRHAVRQGYSEPFAEWLLEADQDEYAGLHRGEGHLAEPVEVQLEAAWNSMAVVLYDPGNTWGFALHFEDARTGRPLKLIFSPDQKKDDLADWSIITDELCPCGYGALPETPAPNPRTFPDPAHLLAWEMRRSDRKAAADPESLLESSAGKTKSDKGKLVLSDGTYVRYDFGGEVVGWIELEVRGSAGSILDLAWAENLSDRGDLEPVDRGRRQVDRLTLAGKWQRVRLASRRALRYLELVARTDGPEIEVRRLGLHESHVPAEEAGRLETGDRAVDAGLALARRTARCCIQRTLEGSPAREAEQSTASAWLLSRVERTLLGRTERSEAALRAFAADQDDKGFFRAVVPAATQHVVPDWCLLWVLHLAEHVAWTGDERLARELYPTAERILDWTAAYRGMDGLLENQPDRRPWWLFVDLAGVEKQGEVTAWQALYVRALREAGRLAALAGEEALAERHAKEADDVVELCGSRLWRSRRHRFADARLYEAHSDSASAQTNYYAVWAGLAGPRRTETILKTLWNGTKETADWGPAENPFVKAFALEALLEQGMVERALAMVGRYWGAAAKAGYATVPEVFIPGSKEAAGEDAAAPGGPYQSPPPRAACHGWGAYVEALLAEHVLGVRPEGPGFEPARLAPMPGRLKKLGGTVWTPKGKVEVQMRWRKGVAKVRYDVPDDLRFRIDLAHLSEGDEVEVYGGEEVQE